MSSSPDSPAYRSSSTLLRYVLLTLIWSSTPLAVVWSVRELHPVWALAARFAVAAPLAYILLRCMSLSLRCDGKALHSYVAGAFGLCLAMLFCYLGAVHLPSAMVCMLFGLSPLIAGFLSHVVFRTEHLYPEQWLGMALGMLGMGWAVGVGDTSAASVSLLGVMWLLLAVFCYVLSMFWVQKVAANLHAVAQTTGSLLLSALFLLLLLPLFWSVRPLQMPSVWAVSAVLYTAVVASVLAFVLYFELVQRIGPTPVALTTVLTPLLAVCWGVLLNHEQLGAHTLSGLVVVLLGLSVYLARELWQFAQKYLS